MVLVDSSVWIGFLNGSEEDVEELNDLLSPVNRVVICGPVLQEILQGIRSDKKREKVKQMLLNLPFLESTADHFIMAAGIYARMRKKGITVPQVDALIAAHAVMDNLALVTRDRHFDLIAAGSDLRLMREA